MCVCVYFLFLLGQLDPWPSVMGNEKESQEKLLDFFQKNSLAFKSINSKVRR